MSEQLAREQLERYVSGIKKFNEESFARDRGERNEAQQEPSQLPSIQSAQSDAGQFNLEDYDADAARIQYMDLERRVRQKQQQDQLQNMIIRNR